MLRRLARKVAKKGATALRDRLLGKPAEEPPAEEPVAAPRPEPEPEPEPEEPSFEGPAVVVYFKRGCPYTRAAFGLLEEREVEHTAIDVTTDESTRSWLRVVTGQRTTPQVFIQGKPIGGYTELRELDLDGGLAPFVRDR